MLSFTKYSCFLFCCFDMLLTFNITLAMLNFILSICWKKKNPSQLEDLMFWKFWKNLCRCAVSWFWEGTHFVIWKTEVFKNFTGWQTYKSKKFLGIKVKWTRFTTSNLISFIYLILEFHIFYDDNKFTNLSHFSFVLFFFLVRLRILAEVCHWWDLTFVGPLLTGILASPF